MTTISPAETERHIKALASHGAGPCCDAAYAAVEHMRTLQQRVTELEAEKVDNNPPSASEIAVFVRSAIAGATQMSEALGGVDRKLFDWGFARGAVSVATERDAAKRELEKAQRQLALRLDAGRELQQMYEAFDGSGHSPKNPREAAQAIAQMADAVRELKGVRQITGGRS